MVELTQPVRIGELEIPNRVVLGPMAGITTSAFRRQMKRHGAGLVFTEMVSAYGIVYENRRTFDYLAFADEERPIGVQLFAADPPILARAAEKVLALGRRPDLLDINMGCPVRKVVKTGAGAAMLADPARAVEAAAAVVRAAASSGVPVTVKMRSGLVPGDRTALEIAPRMEEVGVAAICLHPRAASQMYKGKADHCQTAELKRIVSVPVIASGDVASADAAYTLIDETGADAVMVARGVLGNPWLLDEMLGHVQPGGGGRSMKGVVGEMLLLLDGAVREMGEERGVRWIRTHLGWYLRRMRVPVRRIQELRLLATAGELREQLAALGDEADGATGG